MLSLSSDDLDLSRLRYQNECNPSIKYQNGHGGVSGISSIYVASRRAISLYSIYLYLTGVDHGLTRYRLFPAANLPFNITNVISELKIWNVL